MCRLYFYLPLFILLHLSPTFVVAKIWAVLVSGSTGNDGVDYAVQANVYHAWHILRDHGVDPERIILMAYDDIAYDPRNPHPGKVFNDPKGIDVYAGIKIDYRREDVTVANFQAVLLGNAEKTGGKPVLKSTKDDNVFISYVDHGNSGIIGFPDNIMTVKDLKRTLKGMNAKKMYKKMVFYLEACLSGSMFDSWAEELRKLNIYAVTSSNALEESWGIYCDLNMEDGDGKECKECHDLAPGSCIGTDFGHSWMQNVDFLTELDEETMGTETRYMKMGTLFSPVQEYGDMALRKENISEFMGHEMSCRRRNLDLDPALLSKTYRRHPAVSVNDAKKMFLRTRIARGDETAVEELELLTKRRQYFDQQMALLVHQLVGRPATANLSHMTFTKNLSKISRMDCHHVVMHHFSRRCFNLAKNHYAMTKSFILNNFCEIGLPIGRILSALNKQCKNLKITEGID